MNEPEAEDLESGAEIDLVGASESASPETAQPVEFGIAVCAQVLAIVYAALVFYDATFGSEPGHELRRFGIGLEHIDLWYKLAWDAVLGKQVVDELEKPVYVGSFPKALIWPLLGGALLKLCRKPGWKHE